MVTITLSPKAESRRQWLVRNSGKHCTRCAGFKRLSQFGADATKADGLRSYCKECALES